MKQKNEKPNSKNKIEKPKIEKPKIENLCNKTYVIKPIK